MAWTEEGDALIAVQGQGRSRSTASASSPSSATRASTAGAPKRDGLRPVRRQGVSGRDSASARNRAPQWTEARDAFIFGIAKLTKVPPPAAPAAVRARALRPTGEAADDGVAAQGRARPADDANTERPNLVIWHYKDPRLQSQQQVQEAADRARELRDDVPARTTRSSCAWPTRKCRRSRSTAAHALGHRHEQQRLRAAGQPGRPALPGRLRGRHEDRPEEGRQEEAALGQRRVAGRIEVSLLREHSTSTCSTWRPARRATSRWACRPASSTSKTTTTSSNPPTTADGLDVGQRARADLGRLGHLEGSGGGGHSRP